MPDVTPPPPDWTHGVRVDAGERACGDLVLDLAVRFRRLPPGERVLVTALDPGAPTDLPAWCRTVGHRLLGAAPPHFWIERRAAP